MKYQKTQIGWVAIVIFTLVLLLLVASYMLSIGTNPVSSTGLIIVGSILLLSLLCFYRLVIEIENKTIHIIYGIGLIHIKIRPENIAEVSEIKTPFYAGLGIRITTTGMLYNIQGNKAVKISYGKDKKKTVKIGSPEPSALKEAIIAEFSNELK